jgi:thiamine-phosphate pyrophosphorylase
MHSRSPFPSHGLYAITDGPRSDLLKACAAALDGGAAVIQYRDKTSDDARRHDEAASLADLCARYLVPLIVNDDVELAARIGAAGVHLGKDDADIVATRIQLGSGAIIGVSCYDSLQRARELATAGADYLAFGAFFPSPTKPHARRATPDLLRAAKPLGKPLLAIGGITPDNAPGLIAAGAQFVAAISGVFGQNNVFAATRRYADLFTAK